MAQYSDYTGEIYVKSAVMYLKVDAVSNGKFLDLSANGFDATAVTITDANDGIQLADDNSLREYILSTGLYDLFYDINGNPLPVLLSQIGRIYNNIMFNNGTYICLCSEPLTGLALTGTTKYFFGSYDADALTIISALGITSELEKRLVDTHVKDLKALNSIQTDLFKFGDPDNSVIKVLYGMVGSSIANLKFNWINPIDSNLGNRLSLEAGNEPIVIDNLINFDGSGAFSTFFNAYLKLASPNSFSYYSVFNLQDGDDYKSLYGSDDCYELGCLGQSPTYKGIALKIRRDDSVHSICENTYQNPTKGVQYSEINSSGFYLTNKLANDNLKQYKNRNQIGSTVSDAGASVYYDGYIILGGCPIDGSLDLTKLSILPCGYFHIGGAISASALRAFQDAVIRHCSSKNHFFFKPDETSPV